MRTTKKEVYSVFQLWVKAIKSREAIDHKDVGAYRLDHNSVYGGWRVERICNERGGVEDVFSMRLPAWEFVTALRMSMRTLEALRLNEQLAAELRTVRN